MSQALVQSIKTPLSVGSLASYIHWANQIPLLTLDEEQELANRFRSDNDIEAARKLVLSHLRFVVRIARGYNGYGLPEADLIQEGNIGLMKAVKRFDPTMGVRLVSFAVHWIRAEIHEFILKNWRIVKIATTKAQRKLFFNLRKAMKKTGWFNDEEVKAVAQEFNVTHADVRQMESRLSHYDENFDGYSDEENSSAWDAPVNYLEDHNQNPARLLEFDDWSSKQENHLYQALEMLDERSQEILKYRWLDDNKLTLHELAAKYNVSAERIRQLEKNAMKKLREALTKGLS